MIWKLRNQSTHKRRVLANYCGVLFDNRKMAKPAEVFLCFQSLLSVAKTQQMPLVYIESHNLLKQLIQSLETQKAFLEKSHFKLR